MKRLELTQGQYALVDDDDYSRLSVHTWHANKRVRNGRIEWRAMRTINFTKREKSPQTLMLHRAVLRLEPGDRRIVDHINGDPLDCRKANLRIVTHSQNQLNGRIKRRGSSRYRCVCSRRGKWVVQTTRVSLVGGRGTKVHVGYFATSLLSFRLLKRTMPGHDNTTACTLFTTSLVLGSVAP